MKRSIIILISVITFCSCNDFLGKEPSKSANLPITTVAQLDALLGNYFLFFRESDRNSILCSSDLELSPEIYHGTIKTTSYDVNVVQTATWDVEFTPRDGKDDFWGKEYTKLFHANTVIKYVDQVSGDPRKKADLKAEAHLIRAYSFMQLAAEYCLPYNESTKGELGLTLKTGTSFDEPISRSTLEETHALIVADLEEALKSENPLISNGENRGWRGNKSAAKALSARYYLSIGNYEKAYEYATQSLADHSDLVDYNTEYSYYEDEIKVNGEPLTIYYPMGYNYNDADFIREKEYYYARCTYYNKGWYIPSQELLNLYDQEHDLRYRYHVVESFSKEINSGNIDYPGYIHFGDYSVPSGLSTSEMILIKAEAQARMGNWEEGLTTLETLRVKRIETVGYRKLTAANREDALRLILKERRLERPFALTWYDAKRYNANNETFDDVEYTKEFYSYDAISVKATEPMKTYTLKKGDRRWARPIPYTEIESSQGAIEQNRY